MNLPPLLTQLATVLALGLCFAVLGPLGTYTELSVPVRYAYWVGLVLVGYLNILLAAHAVASQRPGLPHRWAVTWVTLVSSVPTTLAVAWVESLTRAHPLPLSVFPSLFGTVALVQLVMVLFLTRLQPSLSALLLRRQADPVPAPEPTAFLPAFHRRIPPHLGRELLALAAEDHYLRVITASGSDLILMRFADALAELGDEAGLQVHRSWWVAHGGGEALRRDGGRTVVVLRNGVEVPVSRTYLAAVRDRLALSMAAS